MTQARLRPCRAFVSVILTLIAVVGSSLPLAAERRITTTLMPADGQPPNFQVAEDKATPLTFQANPLPQGARLQAVELWIVRENGETDDENAEVEYNTFFIKGHTRNAMTTIAIGQGAPKPGQAATGRSDNNFPDWLKSELAEVRLELQATKELEHQRIWFGGGSDLALNRPRLAITYLDPHTTPPSFSTAQISPISPRALTTSPRAVKHGWLTSSTLASNLKSLAPAFDGNLAYLVRGTELVALRAPSAVPLWSVDGVESGEFVTLTAFGRLHVIGGGQIRSFELAEDRTAPPKEILEKNGISVESKPRLTVDDLSPIAQPAAGPDGSLYLTTNTSIVGINPVLRKLWSIDYGGSSSPPTVGPSGDFVYVIVVPEDTKLDAKLLAIDARTGESRTVTLQKSLRPAAPLSPPVVVDGGEGTELVFVSAAENANGILGLYTNKLAEILDSTGKTTLAWTLKPNGKPLDGVWGQPLPDVVVKTSGKIFATRLDVASKKDSADIYAITWDGNGLKKGKKPVGSVTYIGVSFRTTVGRLTQDANGILYLWDGGQSVLARRTADDQQPPPDADLGAPVEDMSLAFGGSGTLFAIAAGMQEIRALIPYLDASQLKAPCPEPTDETTAPSNCLESPTHFRLNGTVSANTRISAGGAVQFGPDTTMAAGTTVVLVPGPYSSSPAN